MAIQTTAEAAAYNLQAQQSRQLIFNQIGKKAREIKGQLRDGAFGIEIGVKTQEGGDRIHRVADIALTNDTLQGKLGVDVSVHKYKEVGFESLEQGRSVAPSPASSQSLVSLAGRMSAVAAGRDAIKCHQIISDEDMERVSEHFTNNEVTDSGTVKVLQLLKTTLFPQGIPLPANARVISHHFSIVFKPRNIGFHENPYAGMEAVIFERFFPAETETIPYLRDPEEAQIRGSITYHTSTGSWGSRIGRCEPEHRDRGELNGILFYSDGANILLNQITDVARGKALPASIPANAVGSSAVASLTVHDEGGTALPAAPSSRVEVLEDGTTIPNT